MPHTGNTNIDVAASDNTTLVTAEAVIGRFLTAAIEADNAAAVNYAEEALDGIRGVKLLKEEALRLAKEAGPCFTHDSSCCVFLGHLQGYDLYVCHKDDYDSYLLRWGNKPSEYWSNTDLHLQEFRAAQRTIKGTDCNATFYYRMTGIRLFATILAGEMKSVKK